MKKLIFVIVFIAFAVMGYCQQKKNEVRWRDLQGMTFTAGTNFSISGSYPSWTFTPSLTPTFTTVNTGQGANELYDMDQNVQTTDSPTFSGLTASTATVTTLVNTDATVTNLTVSTATITTGIVTDLTATTATVTTLAVTGEASTKTLTTTGPVTASGDVTGGNLVTTGNLSVTGTGATASLTVTGSHTVTGYLNPQGPLYADSSLYFGCDYSNTWMRFFYQQVGVPRSRGVIENMADYYIQAKDGLSQVLAIQRDTTLTESGVNHLNVVKQVYLGKDTTGIGSTANIGTTLYYNGHFYGLIAGEPPLWKQLDN